jgi:hypothetical protein
MQAGISRYAGRAIVHARRAKEFYVLIGRKGASIAIDLRHLRCFTAVVLSPRRTISEVSEITEAVICLTEADQVTV